MKRVRTFIKKVFKIIKRPEMRVLPGQLAFFFVVSLIPLVALVGAIAESFDISILTLERTITEALPSQLSKTLITFVSGKGLNFNMIVFFVSAFILASNGAHSMIITSNEIYKIKDDQILKRRIKAILMTFILVLLLVFLLIIPVYGDSIFNMAIKYNNNKTLVIVYYIYQMLKYPISIILIYINIKLLYTIAPDKEISSKSTTYGSIFTTIAWIISTIIYSFYVSTFTHYDIFYGSISNILVLLLWVYILSYIFVLGMAINVNDDDKFE